MFFFVPGVQNRFQIRTLVKSVQHFKKCHWIEHFVMGIFALCDPSHNSNAVPGKIVHVFEIGVQF